MNAESPQPATFHRQWRRLCAVGAVLVFVVDLAASIAAYTGTLPAALPTANGGDKAGHLLMFGSLAFFLDGMLGYRPIASWAPRWAHLGPIVLWVVVATDEWAQRFSPLRTSELGDLIADTVGIVGFAWVSGGIDAWLRASPRRRQVVGNATVQP